MNSLKIPVLLCLSLAFAGCGRVADPLPPVVEIPEPVSDLAVRQAGYDLRFEWTNPSFHVDRTPVAGLDRAVIRSGAEVVLEVPVSGPGEPQVAFLRDVGVWVGSEPGFSIELAGRSGRLSAPSGPVRLAILEVPGPVVGLGATVDQDRVALEWAPPAEGAELISGFRVYRTGDALAETPADTTQFEDLPYVPGATYIYAVVAVRSTPNGTIEGVPAAPLEVEAVDRRAPAAPAGLLMRPVENGILLTWDRGPETDIAGYRVFRRESGDGPLVPLTDAPQATTFYADAAYADGYAYAVSVLDRTGNESPMSEPVSR